jgi:bifunctional non-homologous end joining protein LigD
LLNSVDPERAQELLTHPDYWMQEKLDGRRLLIKKEGNQITGINRLGLVTSVPDTIADSASHYPGDFIIDGEAVGETLHAFDLLHISGEDIRSKRFAVRFLRLHDLLDGFLHCHIRLVDCYCQPQKAGKYEQFQRAGKEGVVFKDIDAPYTPGRPNAGGSQLKVKFYETASFIVAKPNDKHSVSLILFEGQKVRSAGNVTIPPNHEMPSPGSVIECRYLYAFRESGSIYQPVYLGKRDDVRPEECSTHQLKYKAEVEELTKQAVL